MVEHQAHLEVKNLTCFQTYRNKFTNLWNVSKHWFVRLIYATEKISVVCARPLPTVDYSFLCRQIFFVSYPRAVQSDCGMNGKLSVRGEEDVGSLMIYLTCKCEVRTHEWPQRPGTNIFFGYRPWTCWFRMCMRAAVDGWRLKGASCCCCAFSLFSSPPRVGFWDSLIRDASRGSPGCRSRSCAERLDAVSRDLEAQKKLIANSIRRKNGFEAR